MRAGTAFLITFLLLCAGGLAADAWVTSTAEEQASHRVGAVLGAPTEVELRGWPVSLRLLQGRVPEVALVARDVELAGGVRLDRLEAVVSNVRITFAELRGTDALPVDGGSGTFRADVSEATASQLTGVPVTLGDGLATVTVDGRAVDAVAAVEGGQIVLRPVGGAAGEVPPVPLPLPPLPGEAVIDGVRIQPGVLRVSGQVLRLSSG
jgi:hypothetical protein